MFAQTNTVIQTTMTKVKPNYKCIPKYGSLHHSALAYVCMTK